MGKKEQREDLFQGDGPNKQKLRGIKNTGHIYRIAGGLLGV